MVVLLVPPMRFRRKVCFRFSMKLISFKRAPIPQVPDMARRKTKIPNWYLDVPLIRKYWEGTPRTYHHTAPINMQGL